MPPQDNLDPVSAITALMVLVFSPELASVVGPYAVILLAATTGAAWSLGRRDPATRSNAFWFFVTINMTACLLTVGIASLAKQTLHIEAGVNMLLAPVGLIVGGIGHDWPSVGKWLLNIFRGRIEKTLDSGSNVTPGGTDGKH
jgi:hypothetical protein